jgi:hypothetical protein
LQADLHLAGIAALDAHLSGIRLKFRAVSHGRVTFDTHNDLRHAVDPLSGGLLKLYTQENAKVSG